MKIGCHISVSGGIQFAFQRAEELHCETFQIFTQNQRQWKSVKYNQDTLQNYVLERERCNFIDVTLTAHASYLINLCAQEPDNLNKARSAFLDELKRCDQLQIDGLVIHPGSHGGKGEEWGIAKIADSISFVLSQYSPRVKILLETTAGQGNGIGYRFEHLKQIMDLVEQKDALGVCVDTCHIFAAGYDIRSEQGWKQVFEQMKHTFGLNKIKVWHLNDSKKEFASRKDRHAPVGEGFIGLKSFEILMKNSQFNNTPGILEVPGGDDIFNNNIKLLKKLRDRI